MTYKEWFTTTLSRFNLTEDDIAVMLANQSSLIPDADAEVDVIIAKTVVCREFAMVIPLANISEGGYSVSWNMDGIKFWYNQVCKEVGMQPIDIGSKPQPIIRNKSNLW